jgi:hypothetical protein
MYLYLQPHGGLNDNLVQISKCIDYCKKYNRILLLDTINSTYKVNFGDYFTFDVDLKIIYDIQEIKKILNQKKYTVYPKCMESHMNDVMSGKFHSSYIKNVGTVDLENKKIILPENPKEDIILFIACGGGDGFRLFSKIKLNENTLRYCKDKFNSLQNPYISLQVRNTDYKCDIQKLYDDNKQKINNAKNIYMATDDRDSLHYFQQKNEKTLNFTTFPDKNYRNLHKSDIDGGTQMKNILTDILILAMSDEIISNSMGGFIDLCRKCFRNKDIIRKIYKL